MSGTRDSEQQKAGEKRIWIRQFYIYYFFLVAFSADFVTEESNQQVNSQID